ncbi:hypothetical protein BDY17DRAFT_102223 [Neohortaea acidophila]|uniref:Uncharacterized protein n=1 Tax=Neohortaea acidophila TaxID=245834 RepID=A0A6A6PZD5_9PEZI|nr:uncharacterized protein BDY17DRAFT_102223 [Neohortaea acidophila]KAF2485385.1 hypothetical protein BDY17DRAFT_102223 [Neohortaea acidophila]
MAPSTAASPTSLLWAHQLKREHAYLLKRMQALETQNSAQEARSVSETERNAVRLYEQAQSEILKMKTQIENLLVEQRKAAEERKQALADNKILTERISAVQERLAEYGKMLQQKSGHPNAARLEAIEQQLEGLAQQVQSHGEKMSRLPERVPALGVPHDEVRSAAKATHHSDDTGTDIATTARNPGGSFFPYRRPQGQALESRGGLQSKSGALKTVPSQSMQHLEIEPPQDSSHHENGGTDPGVDDRTLQAPGTKRRRIDQTTVLEVLEPPTSTAIPSMVDSTSASSSKIKPKRSSRVPRGQHATMLHGVVAKDSEDLYAIPRPQKIAVTGSR